MNALTVKDLLLFILANKIPLDSKILYQRIEDVYFEKHGWDKALIMIPDGFGGHNQCLEVFSQILYKDNNTVYLSAHY